MLVNGRLEYWYVIIMDGLFSDCLSNEMNMGSLARIEHDRTVALIIVSFIKKSKHTVEV